jgi:hypothetical protein
MREQAPSVLTLRNRCSYDAGSSLLLGSALSVTAAGWCDASEYSLAPGRAAFLWPDKTRSQYAVGHRPVESHARDQESENSETRA